MNFQTKPKVNKKASPMAMTLFWIVLTIAILIPGGWLFHRLCVRLEDAGYLHYRKSQGTGGGVAGALGELDKLTRPSIEHVVEVKEEAKLDARGDWWRLSASDLATLRVERREFQKFAFISTRFPL